VRKYGNGGHHIQKPEAISNDISAALKDIAADVVVVAPNFLNTTIEASRITEVAQKLYTIGFDHVKSVTGIDYPLENKIELIYHVSAHDNLELSKIILELKTSVDRADARIKTVTETWPSAEYPERETAEFLGVTFEGLPDKGRLMLLDNFEGGPPLRRDFILKTEGTEA
jgi:NADH-quinone oxidoreductase subunit C